MKRIINPTQATSLYIIPIKILQVLAPLVYCTLSTFIISTLPLETGAGEKLPFQIAHTQIAHILACNALFNQLNEPLWLDEPFK